MSPALTAIIPTAAGRSGLQPTLSSLAACEVEDVSLHVVVLENGTQSGVEQIVRESAEKWPAISFEYFHCGQANKSAALNEYIFGLADNRLLFLTDDDVKFDPGILRAYCAAAGDLKSGVVFGGPLKIECEQDVPVHLRTTAPESVAGFPRPGTTYQEGQPFMGANWAVFSDDVKRLHGFDPRFGPGSPLNASGQEREMMRTMKAAGLEFRLVPDAIVWHHVPPTSLTLEFVAHRKYRGGREAGVKLWLRHQEGEPVRKTLLGIWYRHIKLKILGLFSFAVSLPVQTRIATSGAYVRGIVGGWRDAKRAQLAPNRYSPEVPAQAN